MPQSCCSFCQHANPPGAKYCNECGTALMFKPCDECDAVNDRDASACHHCGHPFGEAIEAPPSPAIARAPDPLAVTTPPASGKPAKASAAARADSTLVRALETVEADLAHLELAQVPIAATVRLEPFWRPTPAYAPPPLERLEPESERLPSDPPVHFLRAGDNETEPIGDMERVGEPLPSRRERRSPRAAIAMGLLVVMAGGAFVGYRHTAQMPGLPDGFTDSVASAGARSIRALIGTSSNVAVQPAIAHPGPSPSVTTAAAKAGLSSVTESPPAAPEASSPASATATSPPTPAVATISAATAGATPVAPAALPAVSPPASTANAAPAVGSPGSPQSASEARTVATGTTKAEAPAREMVAKTTTAPRAVKRAPAPSAIHQQAPKPVPAPTRACTPQTLTLGLC